MPKVQPPWLSGRRSRGRPCVPCPICGQWRQVAIPHDAILYRLRNRIERCFNKLKHFRRFSTRYDRLARHFLAFTHIAAARIWMR